MSDVSQNEVFALLSNPRIHDPGLARVERIDTHISALFLAGSRVYKVKKAVCLPFLDFTSLESRRVACEAEVALNRRTAPDLYRGLATINRMPDGRLTLGGGGEPVEWAVVMNRFDQATLFDRLAEQGRLDRDMMIALADVVAAFHRRAQPRPDQGGAAGLRWTITNNAECLARHVPTVFAANAVERLTALALDHLDRLAPLLEQRRRDGFVRFCHGDLHLGNICLYDGQPTPFDAIEFSEAIACIDVLYDLAFLLMDLDHRNQRRLASFTLNRWLERTADYDGLPALPLFLSARAAIRAHVSATMAESRDGATAERLRDLGRAYLERALASLAPVPARLVAVGGLSGTGKSRMSREIAALLGAAPGAVVLRTDVLRKQLMGVEPETRLDSDGYTAEMTRRTYLALVGRTLSLLSQGVSVVADGVFARPEQRAALDQVARQAGVPFQGLWLEARPEVMRRRITDRRRNASDATVEVLEHQLSYELGDMTWTRIDTSGSKSQSLDTACRALGL